MITIKPHHFLDVIKLYGKGIEKFVPDKRYHHNFYSVANELINKHETKIQLTSGKDDICGPCIYINEDGICTDSIDHIPGVNSKDEWNKTLDHRIMSYTKVVEKDQLTALEYCKILYLEKEHIFDVWKEESDSSKQIRYDTFCIGAKKYLGML